MVTTSLRVAGITNVQDAEQRLATLAEHIKNEGPQLIVHLVNWYAYRPEDMRKSLYWNGDAGQGTDHVVLTTKPLFGYYNCDDPNYMEWVLQFSQALGVTELNVDYEGGVEFPEEFYGYYQKRFWDSWFLPLLSRAEKYNLKISVMYEPKSVLDRLVMQQGQDRATILAKPDYAEKAVKILKDDLRKICDRFTIKQDGSGDLIIHPAYKRVAGLPVIWVFHIDASHLTKDCWARAVRELKAEGYVFVLVGTTNGEKYREFDEISQGSNPWLNQLFSGFIDNYPEKWKAAQQAVSQGDLQTARQITRDYFQALTEKGLLAHSAIRQVNTPANFTVAPIAIGFQDAGVRGWGLRQPVYFEAPDRTRTEPGQLFQAYFKAIKELQLTWHLICSGDDICEGTHMLIPDEEYGFSGPYAIAQVAKYLGKKPDMIKAIEVTETFIKQQHQGKIPNTLKPILEQARRVFPAKLI